MQFTAKVLKVLVCVALGLALSGPVLAWNDRGHMTVAFIAYKQLTPTTRDRVNALLKLNPKYSDRSATVTSKRLARRRMTRSTVLASTSADPLKSHDLTWLTALGGRRSSAAACFDAREQHRPEPRFRRQSSQTQLHELRIACVLG